jgi:hypothetical protein
MGLVYGSMSEGCADYEVARHVNNLGALAHPAHARHFHWVETQEPSQPFCSESFGKALGDQHIIAKPFHEVSEVLAIHL